MRTIGVHPLDHELRVEVRELEGGTFEARLVHRRWTDLTIVTTSGTTAANATAALADKLDAVVMCLIVATKEHVRE